MSVLSPLFLISGVLTVTPFVSMSLLEFICSTGSVCSIAGLLCHYFDSFFFVYLSLIGFFLGIFTFFLQSLLSFTVLFTCPVGDLEAAEATASI